LPAHGQGQLRILGRKGHGQLSTLRPQDGMASGCREDFPRASRPRKQRSTALHAGQLVRTAFATWRAPCSQLDRSVAVLEQYDLHILGRRVFDDREK
jgi:hypothetical protein